MKGVAAISALANRGSPCMVIHAVSLLISPKVYILVVGYIAHVNW